MSGKDAPNVVIFPPIAALIALAGLVGLSWFVPLSLLPPYGDFGAMAIGAVLILFATVLPIWGIRTFSKAGTNVEPHKPTLKIVTDGPYDFTRNPMYLGMVLFQPGLALFASLDWVVLTGPALFAVLHYGVVLREEAYLTTKFGAEYEKFLKTTRRWI